MYTRNPYYENTDIRNRINNGEDVLDTIEKSSLMNSVLDVIESNPDVKTVYQVGFCVGAHFKVLKDLQPKLKLYGCEFDPMFLNFGQNHFDITTNAESVHISNCLDSWKSNGTYDVVFVENWFNSLDRNEKAVVFKKIMSLAKICVVFEKLDEDFDYDKTFNSVEQKENGTATVKPIVSFGPELTFGKIKLAKKVIEDIKANTKDKEEPFLGVEKHEPNLESIYDGLGVPEELRDKPFEDLGEHPPIKGEEDET